VEGPDTGPPNIRIYHHWRRKSQRRVETVRSWHSRVRFVSIRSYSAFRVRAAAGWIGAGCWCADCTRPAPVGPV